MTSTYGARTEAMAELGAKQPHELLLMLGGALAVLLCAAIYGIAAATPPGIQTNQISNVVTIVIINVVLGAALWASAAITRKSLMNGAIVAGLIGILRLDRRRRRTPRRLPRGGKALPTVVPAPVNRRVLSSDRLVPTAIVPSWHRSFDAATDSCCHRRD